MKILVVNCGSSSIKYQLYEMPDRRVLAKGLVERIGEAGSSLRVRVGASASIALERPIPDHEEGMRLILQTPAGAAKTMRWTIRTRSPRSAIASSTAARSSPARC